MKRVFPLVLVLAVILLIVGLVVGWYLWSLQPKAKAVATNTFVVGKGESVSQIAQKLQDEGLIRSRLSFLMYIKMRDANAVVQAGSFTLSPSQSVPEIISTLKTGTEDVWVTIPEGWRKEQIAESFELQLDSYSADQFISLASDLEGTLFPDTYLVPRLLSEEQSIRLLTSTYERKTKDLDFSSNKNFSSDELLVLASLIQREARTYEQMRHVSGILQNRLSIGMPLQVDATLQYAKGKDAVTGEWWPTPLAADKQINSPFNTYQNPGLPPEPICNPGLDAIKAALDPLPTDDLFYVHALDGTMYYSQTLEGHNRNIETYLR